MCPLAQPSPMVIDLNWSEEKIISLLTHHIPGSDLPDNVLEDSSPFQYPPSNLLGSGEKDASGNRLLLDSGLWLTQKIKVSWTQYVDQMLCYQFRSRLMLRILRIDIKVAGVAVFASRAADHSEATKATYMRRLQRSRTGRATQ